VGRSLWGGKGDMEGLVVEMVEKSLGLQTQEEHTIREEYVREYYGE
jgi:hypothetical protein